MGLSAIQQAFLPQKYFYTIRIEIRGRNCVGKFWGLNGYKVFAELNKK